MGEAGDHDGHTLRASLADPTRFSAVFDRYFADVHRFVARRVGRDGADDLAAAVFAEAFAGRRSFDATVASARPWLFGIATNLLRRYHRTEVRRLHAYARHGVDPIADDGVSGRRRARRQHAGERARGPADGPWGVSIPLLTVAKSPARSSGRCDHEGMSNPYWPLFDLRVRTPRLELRYPDDDDLALIAALAAEGIHDPDAMPFYVPWSRAESPALERGVLQFTWSRRGELSPESWGLPFLVSEGARAVGVQELSAKQFAVTRSVETGSWLVRSAHGRGIGTEMRAAVLHLAFAGLGADEAHSASFDDNPASEAVSRANGYEANGSVLVAREGQAARSNKWVLTRERWLDRCRDDVDIVGLDPCREILGATEKVES